MRTSVRSDDWSDIAGAFALLLQAREVASRSLSTEDLRRLQVNARIVSLAPVVEEWAVGADASVELTRQYTGKSSFDFHPALKQALSDLRPDAPNGWPATLDAW